MSALTDGAWPHVEAGGGGSLRIQTSMSDAGLVELRSERSNQTTTTKSTNNSTGNEEAKHPKAAMSSFDVHRTYTYFLT